jgi:hypothetical protein
LVVNGSYQDWTIILHLDPGLLQGSFSPFRVFDQQVDQTLSAALEAAAPQDVDPGAAQRFSQLGQVSRPVFQNDRKICRHTSPPFVSI